MRAARLPTASATYHIPVGRRRAGGAALFVALALAAATARADRAPPPNEFTETVVEVAVNTRDGGDMLVLLRDAAGRFWLGEDDFARFNLSVPARGARTVAGRRYFALDRLPGIALEFDAARQHLDVKVAPEAFAMTRLSATAARGPDVTPASPGAFVNYQLSGQRVTGTTVGGALAEVGAFAGAGVATATVVARSLAGRTETLRLDTTFTHDFIDRMETVNVGDAISDGGAWGNAVRFGGLRWARNFAIRPDLLTTPLLTAGGTAVVPSTVDVFVNSQRVSSTEVPAGPFVVDNVPAVTGSGDVRVVVRDALGREQVTTQSFYSGVTLLAPGLAQYSVDVGRVREDYALVSNRYGAWLGAATYRQGLTSDLTIEGHVEAQAGDAHALGFQLASNVVGQGIVTLTAAAGGDARGHGALLGLGYERRRRHFSLIANTLYAGDGFRQVGDRATLAPVAVGAVGQAAGTPGGPEHFRMRSLAQVGVDLGRAGSLAAAAVVETFPTEPRLATVSLSHSLAVGGRGALSLTVSHTSGAVAGTSAYLTFTASLGGRRAVVATASGGSGPGTPANELYATALENPPVGPGLGWRLGGSTSGNYEASVKRQWEPVDVELAAARNQGIAGQSLYVRGAATLLDGQVRATRGISGSFAVVDVGGLPDVPVYLDNQLVAHSDASGRALLPNLRSYEPNRISVAPEELPLETDIAARTLVIAPGYRSGVVARFPVTRIRGATFVLVDGSEQPLPAGTVVEVGGETFPVALKGLTYITNLDAAGAGRARGPWGECRFDLPSAPASDPQPDLGTIRCMGASRRGEQP
jgi:outer membrane usher protein